MGEQNTIVEEHDIRFMLKFKNSSTAERVMKIKDGHYKHSTHTQENRHINKSYKRKLRKIMRLEKMNY